MENIFPRSSTLCIFVQIVDKKYLEGNHILKYDVIESSDFPKKRIMNNIFNK